MLLSLVARAYISKLWTYEETVQQPVDLPYKAVEFGVLKKVFLLDEVRVLAVRCAEMVFLPHEKMSSASQPSDWLNSAHSPIGVASVHIAVVSPYSAPMSVVANTSVSRMLMSVMCRNCFISQAKVAIIV